MSGIDLNNFADGGLAEKFNDELQKVLENMADPNTDPTKVRSITLSVSLKGDKKREVADVSVRATSKLQPYEDLETKLIMDRDSKGKMVGKELLSGTPGQTYFDDEGLYEDTGEKIVDFRKQKANGGNK
ncbi:replication terminator protein [Alkalicoccobacillus plakortidis]|uniref:Replication terminator protein n=1 Tax=Alkalicoccobacillus plakortidis TaxID=444060 RepID=A0ABT0XJQ5_9BACI|nr:replication terminator protein [Alkalicoccobacillus plakortidis]MCM2675598.1 replication terminator protein [Alkalicoccobacillus plakortidis]